MGYILLLLEYQPATEAAAVSALFRNLQNEFVLWRGPPDQPGPRTCPTVAQDFDGLAVYSPRRSRSGTFALLKIAGHAVEVQDHAGTGRAAVFFNAVEGKHLPFGVLFY